VAKKRRAARTGPIGEPDLIRSFDRVRSLARPLEATVFRAVATRYASREDLWTGAGARANGGRWNPPGRFHAVYASVDVETATTEYFGNYRLVGLEAAVRRTPLVIASARVCLRSALDLTDAGVLRALELSAEDLVASGWQAEQEAGREPATQAVGRLAYAAGVEGLVVPSAARPGGANVVVFFWNLSPPDSYLSPINPDQLPGIG
jgi:RES domain-containing protein